MTTNPDSTPGYFETAYRDYVAQNPDKKLDHYLATIDSHLSQQRDIRLLDIGCGRGAFLRRASEVFPDWKLDGTDIDEQGVAYSRQLVPSATIQQADATDRLFEDETFDVVTAWDLLEHVTKPDGVFAVVSQILKPNGIFTLVVPVYDGITGPLIRHLDQDHTHIHKRSRSWWLIWTAKHFEILEWHGVLRYLLRGRRYLHVPTRALRTHTPAILIVAKRR